ncbi:hypothetical protein A2954_06680 [Candidatus Roizmanbacteria bacterium RIFCSPLOWO2_01_FULL_37_12]|uniref:Uncharacterized protein n=1 Tax=Candidatus Roizmanbacteria bacterium RIFCSPLOWO2_01_FULL_37_12 TaxID=1802056 RepID=A0A1F7I966_9BACT|nr:MAG: hypothetical protein A2768_01805 [Candidatus Roizmanbacteria bacterium RIFCSPHIGHO2_01_FULL_37_16]OGK25712.1 MAG: hypothetical protein A3D76_04860 [Candidatus Roizmanbacteria bacterium RIFCSPHIGHO2_02_FULL_37_9b]OGK39915.1 MAG: hypothetical protein A2954_06680 [Candidatus Roizmanbacteria bacterium RIFCSPLOWO2_01_FULL_37_12]
MDLLTYAIIAFVYIMVMHFAIGINDDFNIFLMVGIFIIGAAMGAYVHSYDFGFGAAIILSLIFW